MRNNISSILKAVAKKAYTQDDLLRDYQDFSPTILNAGDGITINNIVEASNKKFKVMTSLQPSDYENEKGEIIRIDFTTIEQTEKTKHFNVADEAYDYKVIENLKNELLKIFKYPKDMNAIKSIKTIKDVEKFRTHWIPKNLMEKFDEDVYQHTNHMIMSPTLNVPNLSSKVFSSVILSIFEGFKRFFLRYPNKKIAGMEIDSKKDFTGDNRRSEIYEHLMERFLGRSFPYTKKGTICEFKTPLTSKSYNYHLT